MSQPSGAHVKKTITLPTDLVEQMRRRSPNVSAFIAEACREKLHADERKAREAAMIERCRARFGEDLEMAQAFFEAEEEAWASDR